MFTAVLALHVVIAVALVVLVLINQGKGADMGAAFGSGASSTVFGSAGAATFMTKLIASLGTLFFATSLGLAIMASRGIGMGQESSVIGDAPQQAEGTSASEASEAPDEPDSPDSPNAPGVPEQETPKQEEAPGQPVESSPGGPEAPVAPGGPEAPASPNPEGRGVAPEAPPAAPDGGS